MSGSRSYRRSVNVTDIVRVLLDDSVGNAGAMRNCRAELAKRRDAEQQIDALCRRMPSSGDGDVVRDAATA